MLIMESRKNNLLSTLYILIAGALWGCISIFVTKLKEYSFSSMQCVAIRAFFTTLFLLIYILITDRTKLKIKPIDLLCFVGTGLLSINFFNYCYFEAIEEMQGAAIPALLLYTAPIFVMIMSLIFFKEKLTIVKVISLIGTFIGLIFVTGAFFGDEKISMKALLLGLGSGFGYALYSIFGKVVVKRYHTITITFYTFMVAFITMAPFVNVMGIVDSMQGNASPVYAILLALFSTTIPYLLYTKGLNSIEAGKASIYATIEPFVAAIVGIIIFDEIMTMNKLIGMAFILCSIIYLNIGNKFGKKLTNN